MTEEEQENSSTDNLRTEGGAVVMGDVRVVRGDFVGRDRGAEDTQQSEDQPPTSMPSGNYNVPVIRNLIRDAFTPNDLQRFCHDRPIFRPILHNFGPGFSLDDMIDVVIAYCEKRLLFSELLQEIRTSNPSQYERYRSLSTGHM